MTLHYQMVRIRLYKQICGVGIPRFLFSQPIQGATALHIGILRGM